MKLKSGHETEEQRVKLNDSSFIWRESSLSKTHYSTFMRPVPEARVSRL